MRPFEAVIFDMDGVLFDSERAMLECWDDAAKAHGFFGMEKPYLDTIGVNVKRTWEIIVDAFGETFPLETIDRERLALFRERYGGGRLPMKDGVVNILSFLRRAGIKIAMATSSGRDKTVMQLQGAGILEYFDAIVTGDMVTESKPDPAIFLRAAREIGADPAHTYVIEDSFEGIRAAHKGGFHPIMIPDMLPPDEEMHALSEVVLQNLDEAVRYLSGEEKNILKK